MRHEAEGRSVLVISRWHIVVNSTSAGEYFDLLNF
jgi:hypothetical protein